MTSVLLWFRRLCSPLMQVSDPNSVYPSRTLIFPVNRLLITRRTFKPSRLQPILVFSTAAQVDVQSSQGRQERRHGSRSGVPRPDAWGRSDLLEWHRVTFLAPILPVDCRWLLTLQWDSPCWPDTGSTSQIKSLIIQKPLYRCRCSLSVFLHLTEPVMDPNISKSTSTFTEVEMEGFFKLHAQLAVLWYSIFLCSSII